MSFRNVSEAGSHMFGVWPEFEGGQISMGLHIWQPEGLFSGGSDSGSVIHAGCTQRVLKSPAAQQDLVSCGILTPELWLHATNMPPSCHDTLEAMR